MASEVGTKHSSLISAFLEHQKILAAYLSQRLMKPEDVDDILQETVAEALVQDGLQEIRSPKAYLFIVARNIMSRQLKKQAKDMSREIDDLDLNMIPCDDISLERQIDGRDRLRALLKAAAELPPQCRKVFLLRKIYGWSHKKIAARLGISTSTVERHITIALSRLDVTINAHKETLSTGSESADLKSGIV